MRGGFIKRLINRLCGEPAEDLEDTSERLAVTRAMVEELAGKEAATLALKELDEMVAKKKCSPPNTSP